MDAGATVQWSFIITGLLLGLFGWMCYWAGTLTIGVIVGGGALGMLGYLAGGLLIDRAPQAAVFCSAIGVVVGAIGGVIFIRALMIYFFFAAGASLGGALVWKLAQAGALATIPGASRGGGLSIAIIVGVVAGGFLLVALRRFIVAVVTSVVGATLFSIGLPPAWQGRGWLVSLVVFLIVQAGLVQRFVDRESFDRRAMHPRYRHEAADDEDDR